jgi:DNA-directed RNA polymerase specialized sigma24 family protein
MGNAELSRILTEQYPQVHRVARGLCGDDLATMVTRTVFVKSLRASEKWRGEESSANWFLRQTLLQGRNAVAAKRIVPTWRDEATQPIELRAILKAFSALPYQQREAFLLGRGERMDIQRTAIAMDCSMTAAAMHLAAAEKAIAAIAGRDAGRLTRLLFDFQAAAPPAGDLVIGRAVRRHARRRLIRRLIKLAIAILILFAALFFWRIYRTSIS